MPNIRMMTGIPLLKPRKTIVRFFENVRKLLTLWTEALNGFSNGKKIQAPTTLIVRWISQTPIAAGFPVAKAAIITSKTVPILAPRIYGKM
jgi:hypothetical protein